MAKIYGNRWELIGSLSSGGQGEVFRVRDLRGEYSGELALKRVLNPARHERFRNEVEAIKLLNSEHIIKLLDHSALTETDGKIEKQYLVMPLAREDLSKRVELYTSSVDSVLLVAKRLATALITAHAAGIIHRDVKPQNILFHSANHDLWLADFGICLIREKERVTGEAEVVGPVQFMGPELDGGGQLDVSPAADVYSFGKVIYYMLSGGIILPRERMNEPRYSAIFDTASQRQQLLKVLLSRMVCPLSNRLQTMTEVMQELLRVEDWEKTATAVTANPQVLSRLAGIKQKLIDQQLAKERAELARTLQQETINATRDGVLDWLEQALVTAAEVIAQGGVLTAGVRRVASSAIYPVGNYRTGSAVELWVRNPLSAIANQHVLRFSFCTRGSGITVRVQMAGMPAQSEPPVPQNSEVAILPTYAMIYDSGGSNQQILWHLFTADGGLLPHKPPQQSARPLALQRGRPNLFQQQPKPVTAQMCQFTTESWPAVAQHFKILLEDSIDSFTKTLERVV